jgi:hypothetical protein
MRASILSLASFRLRRESAAVPSRNWSQQELAELYRVRDRLVQSGLRVALDLGLTDEGEPWAVFVQSESGEAFVHIARLGGTVIVANMMANVVYRGEDFRAITDQMLQDAPLVLPAGKASDSKVVMHPRSIFTAFVAAAVVLSEFVRTIEPAKAATEQEKLAQDKVVAETKALFPVIFDRVLARDATWSSPIVTHGAAASLMAAAVGAVLMIEEHQDDLPAIAADGQEWLVAEATTTASADGASTRAEHAASAAPTREEQAPSAPAADPRFASATAEAAADEERTAVIDTPAGTDSKPLAEQVTRAPEAPPELPFVAPPARIAASSAAEQGTGDTSQPSPAQQTAAAPETKGSKELSLILDSILTVRLPDGASERVITQAIDKVLERAPNGEEGPATLMLANAGAEGKESGSEQRSWVLHTSAGEGGPAVMNDRNHDVVLLTSEDITVYNFRFNEDYLLFDGEIDSTSWIKSIEVHGDDVVILATNGSVVSLIDTHGLIA